MPRRTTAGWIDGLEGVIGRTHSVLEWRKREGIEKKWTKRNTNKGNDIDAVLYWAHTSVKLCGLILKLRYVKICSSFFRTISTKIIFTVLNNLTPALGKILDRWKFSKFGPN